MRAFLNLFLLAELISIFFYGPYVSYLALAVLVFCLLLSSPGVLLKILPGAAFIGIALLLLYGVSETALEKSALLICSIVTGALIYTYNGRENIRRFLFSFPGSRPMTLLGLCFAFFSESSLFGLKLSSPSAYLASFKKEFSIFKQKYFITGFDLVPVRFSAVSIISPVFLVLILNLLMKVYK